MEKKSVRKLIISKVKKEIKENIYNIPNFLTILRVLLTFAIIYMILTDVKIIYIVIAFAFGMFTDFLDGHLARKLNMKTEFGRKADMIADRFLMIGTVVTLIAKFSLDHTLDHYHLLQILIILIREIVAFPFAIVMFVSGKELPHANFLGKMTTFLQAFAFPFIMLSIFYSSFSFSIYVAVFTGVIGFFSGLSFMKAVIYGEKK